MKRLVLLLFLLLAGASVANEYDVIINAGRIQQSSGIYDVTAYGAIVDDGLNDVAGIQAAIDAVEAAGRGSVFFPAGVYLVKTSLGVDGDNIRLYGLGSATITTDTSFTVIDVQPDADNITVEGLNFTSTATGGFVAGRGSINFAGTSGNECNNILVTDCYFYDTFTCAVTGAYVTDGVVSNNRVENVGEHGFYFAEGSNRIVITGNTIDGVNLTATDDHSGIKITDGYVDIIGNFIYDIADTGSGSCGGMNIEYSSASAIADGATVTGNYIQGCTEGIRIGSISNVTVSGNAFHGNILDGFYGDITVRAASDTVSNIVISGNQFFGSSANGSASVIWVEDSENPAYIDFKESNEIYGSYVNTFGLGSGASRQEVDTTVKHRPKSLAIASPDSGDVYYDSDDNALKVYDGQWSFLSASATETKTSSWPIAKNSSAGTSFVSIGGYHLHAASDNDFNPSVNFGTANGSYAAHFFVVAAAGATDTEVTVTGTSISDLGSRATSDTEVISLTDGSANVYYETSKKWIGLVSVNKTAGTDRLCNYGYVKYWDNANNDFTLTAFECLWEADKTDAGFDIRVHHHKATGWTYNAGASATEPILSSLQSVHNTEHSAIGGQPGAFKLTGLSTEISGGDDEGIIFSVVTTSNNVLNGGSIQIWFTD